MTKFINPVSSCCGESAFLCPECMEDYVCTQCGDHCELVEGDEDEVEFNKKLLRADEENDALREEKDYAKFTGHER